MKKSSLILFLLVAILFSMNSEGYGQAPTKDENSLLWKISGNGLSVPSYLYGTIHLIPRKDFFITDSTMYAIRQAESVAFEFNIQKELKIIPQLLLMFKMRMKGDTTLNMLLDQEDYEYVKRKFADKRIPMKIINRIKPSLISDLAGMDAGDIKSGSNTSYEMEFLAIAKNGGKKIAGLETASYQLRVFDSIPYKAQAEMMVQELKSGGEESKREYKKLLKLYKKQDLKGLEKVIMNGDELSYFNQILLYNRNRNWIPVIEKMSKKKKMFYAVGAGHLVGERGVISLLRKRGFTVTAVK
jgi:uncharacterized protein